MKNIAIGLGLVFFTNLTFANIEEDKNAGTCAMYIFVAQKLKLTGSQLNPNDAMALSDKPARAKQYAQIYSDKLKEKFIKKESIDTLTREGVSSCYAIGLKLTQ